MTVLIAFRLALLLAGGVASAADAVLPLPSNLRAEGIPPIPLDLAHKVVQYNEYRSATFADWHPVKRELLILTRFGDVRQVHRVAMPGGARTQITFYPDTIGGAAFQPVSGERLIFSKDVGGSEFYQYYLSGPGGGDPAMITDGKSRNGGLRWSRDGRRFVYNSSRRNGRDMDFYLAGAEASAKSRLLLQVDGGGWGALSWSPDNRKLLVLEYRSINDTSLHLVDAESGARELLTPRSEKVSYGAGVFSADGKGIYLTTDQGSEFQRLAYMDLASRNISFLRPDLKWDVDEIVLSQDGRRLAYVVNEAGISRLYVMDTQSRKELPVPSLPVGVMGAPEWHSNGRDLAFSLSSARSTQDVYSVDLEAGRLERWTVSETGGLNVETFPEPQLIEWKSFDGRTISGFLYRPPARFSGPRPVIVDIHGGPEAQFRPQYLGRINYFPNELGVAMIYPNVRGSAGYGKTFLMLDNAEKREESVKDIGALLDWIAKQPGLDADRVMVQGGSYGGYMTLASLAHYNDRLRGGIDRVGISNWITFLERTEAYRRDLRRAEYGDERDPAMRSFLEKISPVRHAAKITKPLFVVQGANDPRVPAHESEQMVAAIRKNGTRVWYLVAEDEGHGFAKKSNQNVEFAATVLFVKEFLLE